MNFRPTKITKFFPIESSTDPYRFFPNKNNNNSINEPINDSISNPTRTTRSPTEKNTLEEEVIKKETPLNTSTTGAFPIALVTLFHPPTKTTFYCLYFNNLRNKCIFSKIDNMENPVLGDLNALIESLQYIIYNPLFYNSLNREKMILYTNSTIISNIFKPFSSLITDNIYSKAYFKIQGLLKCIKYISVELQDIHSYPCSEALKILKLNINNNQ